MFSFLFWSLWKLWMFCDFLTLINCAFCWTDKIVFVVYFEYNFLCLGSAIPLFCIAGCLCGFGVIFEVLYQQPGCMASVFVSIKHKTVKGKDDCHMRARRIYNSLFLGFCCLDVLWIGAPFSTLAQETTIKSKGRKDRFVITRRSYRLISLSRPPPAQSFCSIGVLVLIKRTTTDKERTKCHHVIRWTNYLTGGFDLSP